jgi:hypothetical protein
MIFVTVSLSLVLLSTRWIAFQNLTILANLQKRVGFSEATGGRALSFRDVSMGETAAQSLSRGMRRGQNSPVDTLLKRPAREPWPLAHRAYAPEGAEERPTLVKKI